MNTMMKQITWPAVLAIISAPVLGAANTAPASSAAKGKNEPASIEEQQIPRIVLHDILTDRVCINESKLYSLGGRVIMLGKEYICTNVKPMSFAGENSSEHWEMKWVPVDKTDSQ